MEVLIKVLQLILSLSLLVFVHELGHYLTARMFGIRVEKFYLFFDAGGFSIFKFRIGETTFGLGWVPFGGYCKISGMIDESMDTESMKRPPEPWEFRSKPAWQRLIVMVGGVTMNIITACLIYIGISWHWGDTYIDNKDVRYGYAFNATAHEIGFEDGDKVVSVNGEAVTDYRDIYMAVLLDKNTVVKIDRHGNILDITVPETYTAELLKESEEPFITPIMPFIIGSVIPGGGAAKAGFEAGDTFVAFDGEPMERFELYRKALAGAAGMVVDLTVMRDSAGVRVLRTLPVEVSAEGLLGVERVVDIVPVSMRHYNFGQAVPAGFRKAGAMIGDYWKQLKMIVSPQTKAYKQVGSLITIGNFFPGVWDWLRFWSVTALLSVVLAVMNILPIPALDGGHVLFTLWEIVTRRKPSDKFLEWAQIVGMVLLLALLVLAFWNDIYRFFIK